MATINFNNIKFVAAYGTDNQLPQSSLPEIVFVGKSNVGKSSLLNKLCNNKNLAKVSASPGKTTTINFFNAEIAYFVDLPGYGYAKRSKDDKQRWSYLIDNYFKQDRNFNLILSLIDIRHDPSELDVQMVSYIKNLGLPFSIVLTKADKISKQKQSVSINKFEKLLGLYYEVPIYCCSSQNNIGIAELKNAIQNTL